MSSREYRGGWDRLIDAGFLAPPVVVLVMALTGVITAVLSSSNAGSGPVETVFGSVLGAQYLFLLLGIPVVLAIGVYKDAASIRRSNIRWSPSPILYTIGSLFVPLVGFHYLWKRYKYIPRPTHEKLWWYLSVGVLLLTLLAPLGIFTTFMGAMTTSANGLMGGMALTFIGFLTTIIGILALGPLLYMDARYLHAEAARKQLTPINPANYLLGMPFAMVGSIFFLHVFVFLYYANKRRKIAGLI